MFGNRLQEVEMMNYFVIISMLYGMFDYGSSSFTRWFLYKGIVLFLLAITFMLE